MVKQKLNIEEELNKIKEEQDIKETLNSELPRGQKLLIGGAATLLFIGAAGFGYSLLTDEKSKEVEVTTSQVASNQNAENNQDEVKTNVINTPTAKDIKVETTDTTKTIAEKLTTDEKLVTNLLNDSKVNLKEHANSTFKVFKGVATKRENDKYIATLNNNNQEHKVDLLLENKSAAVLPNVDVLVLVDENGKPITKGLAVVVNEKDGKTSIVSAEQEARPATSSTTVAKTTNRVETTQAAVNTQAPVPVATTRAYVAPAPVVTQAPARTQRQVVINPQPVYPPRTQAPVVTQAPATQTVPPVQVTPFNDGAERTVNLKPVNP